MIIIVILHKYDLIFILISETYWKKTASCHIFLDSCDMLPQLEEMLIECNEDYSLFTEEDRNFTAEWTIDMLNNETDVDSFNMSFKFQSMFDLRGIPYWGLMNTYGGGGYVDILYFTINLQSDIFFCRTSRMPFFSRRIFAFSFYNLELR